MKQFTDVNLDLNLGRINKFVLCIKMTQVWLEESILYNIIWMKKLAHYDFQL